MSRAFYLRVLNAGVCLSLVLWDFLLQPFSFFLLYIIYIGIHIYIHSDSVIRIYVSVKINSTGKMCEADNAGIEWTCICILNLHLHSYTATCYNTIVDNFLPLEL